MIDNTIVPQETNSVSSILRGVDLNLLTIFEVVMQERNMTRAAKVLGMSQPAVSNAIARLKDVFNDDLFIRHGRGIQPTSRAEVLFSSINNALNLVRDELPNVPFTPESSTRNYSVSMRATLQSESTTRLVRDVSLLAPNVSLNISMLHDQELSFMVDKTIKKKDFYVDFSPILMKGYRNTLLSSDELVVISSTAHSRLSCFSSLNLSDMMGEQFVLHPAILDMVAKSEGEECVGRGAHVCHSIQDLVTIVANTQLVSIVPRRAAELANLTLDINIVPCPIKDSTIKTYLSWHTDKDRDAGHVWMRDQFQHVFNKQMVMTV
ncbi:transcriptional activator for leuABCD operon [Vibrio ishigakensis]|uniref:Transcriptional activator for leuABCD operon n=1 Tax=Vibrio ishigakensis TaxID=1481914 RepID=A0A0B8PDX3_9VIBR|nr:transcriptional activator for leuABCD operon [Vibrio ishigakensis]